MNKGTAFYGSRLREENLILDDSFYVIFDPIHCRKWEKIRVEGSQLR